MSSIFKCASYGTDPIRHTRGSDFGFGFLWTQATHLSLIRPTGMGGVKGRSGGWRPGAGRKPGASALAMKAVGKIRVKATKKAELPATVSVNKISSFFAVQPRMSSEQQTCATPHLVHWTLCAFGCLLPTVLEVRFASADPLVVLCPE